GGIGLVGNDVVDQLLYVQIHEASSGVGRNCRPRSTGAPSLTTLNPSVVFQSSRKAVVTHHVSLVLRAFIVL
ncbi:hypothetical protein, partial [Rhodococcus sp. MEB041]|uniref:hypothetical protein n=1 Tax=Rhodococcus sp. MEB041 TaxID=3040323 RepID=UPI00254C0D61